MSKYSEKTKKYIRFFANASESKTIDDLVEHLGLPNREAKIGKRKVRHTIGDLTYSGLLLATKPNGYNHKRYKLSSLGKKVAAEFHVALPKAGIKIFAKNTNQEDVKIIPKVNDFTAPSTPIANYSSKTVTKAYAHLQESFDKFTSLCDNDITEAVKVLGKQVIILRDELSKLKV